MPEQEPASPGEPREPRERGGQMSRPAQVSHGSHVSGGSEETSSPGEPREPRERGSGERSVPATWAPQRGRGEDFDGCLTWECDSWSRAEHVAFEAIDTCIVWLT